MSDWWNADPVAVPAQNNFWQSDPVANQPQQRGVMDQLLGLTGPRYQLWPEKAVRQLAGDVQGLATHNDAIPNSSNYTDADEALRQANAAAAPGAAYDIVSAISPAARGGIPVFGTSRAPTEAMLEAAKTAQYGSPAVSALRVNPSVGERLADAVKTKLLQNKLDDQNAPDVLKAVSGLANGGRFEPPTQVSQTELAGPGFHIANDYTVPAPLQMSDFDLARQSLGNVPFEQRRAASIARGVLDDYLGGGINPNDVMGGDLGAATQDLLNARGNTASLKRSQEVTSALTRSENQTGSTYSGTGFDNATRQALRPILNEKMGVSKRPGFEDYTDPEIEAARNAVNGNFYKNTVRGISKLTGAGHGLGAGIAMIESGRALHEAGVPGPIAAVLGAGVGGTGWALNKYANYLTHRDANAVGELLRQRSPLADQMKTQIFGAQPAMALPYRPVPFLAQQPQPLVSALQAWLAQRPAAADQQNN